MEFSVETKIEVDSGADELVSKVPITVQVIYRGGRWQAQCIEPPISTVVCDSMEEALVQAAKEAAKEMAASS